MKKTLTKNNINLIETATFAKDLAFEAGELLLKKSKKINKLKIKHKVAQGVATSADLESENLIIKKIKNCVSSHNIF